MSTRTTRTKTTTDPPKAPPRPRAARRLRVTNPHAAGIDIHSDIHWVAVPPDHAPAPPPDHPANLPAHVRAFGACTADLYQLADWLAACGVRTVAMESTGVYWIPLFELLEARGLEVYLVDPRQSRHAPGRPKSDVLDCQWLQRLHSYGLLTASFRPAERVVVLRAYLRQRQMLLRYAGQHVQHMQKALEQMNVKLTEVVSDVTGVTGLAIIKAILAGERDPDGLAGRRNVLCKRTRAEIARALEGSWRAEHLFALKQAVALYEFYHQQMRECDAELEAHLRTFADRADGRPLEDRPGYKRRSRRANDLAFEAVRERLYRMAGVDLTVLEAVDEGPALVILAEVGTDVSRFPTAKHFTSWLGLCPQHQGSAGRIKSRGVRRGANRAGRALRLAVRGCHHAKNALGAFYRRVQARAGAPKAIVATARKLAERVYRLLRYGEQYVRRDAEEYEAAYRARVVKGLARRAGELGYRLEPTAPTGT
ncbi:IS110 family RNA-guided transposase [Urbifossiella limnaea]|uniref:Transposase n=1 Tax=Urbifossiella limnaea TaxID=2528023 RepID=A0A517XUV3_9BACT|nr:IS110 family transposase [Urbifossiella limnaea]QDU21288.1 Transposase [Urbifossiella limnaea]